MDPTEDAPPPAAPLGSRALAVVLDGLVQALVLAPFAATLLVVTAARTDPRAGPLGPGAPATAIVTGIAAPFVVVGYHTWLEARYAETVGKRLLGLRVVDTVGVPITWREAILRNVLRPIDALPIGYLLGAGVAVLDDDRRRLGDVAAGSRVVDRGDLGEGATRGLPATFVPGREE